MNSTDKHFEQVMVWHGTIVPKGKEKGFEEHCLKELGIRVKFIEVIKTGPDYKDGYPVEDTGGRTDCFFYIHSEDISKFAVARFKMGHECPRWIEDVLDNEKKGYSLYPERVKEMRTW